MKLGVNGNHQFLIQKRAITCGIKTHTNGMNLQKILKETGYLELDNIP